MQNSLGTTALRRFLSLDSDCVPILQDVSERRRPEESSICVLPIMKTFAEHLKAFSEASLHESDVIITQLASLVKDYVLENPPSKWSRKLLLLLHGLEVSIVQLLTCAGTLFPKEFYCETITYGKMGAARHFSQNTPIIIDHFVGNGSNNRGSETSCYSFSSCETFLPSNPPNALSADQINPVVPMLSSDDESLCGPPLLAFPTCNSGDDDEDGNEIKRHRKFSGDCNSLLDKALDVLGPVLSSSLATPLGQNLLRIASRTVYLISCYNFGLIQRLVWSTLNKSKVLEDGELDHIVLLQHSKPKIQDILSILDACMPLLGDLKRSTTILLTQNLHQLIWNWIEAADGEYSLMAAKSRDDINQIAWDLSTRALELFDLLEALCAEKKSNPSVDRKRLALWPVMILLLSISDRACDSPGTDDLLNSHHQESRFLQKLQSSLRSTSKTQRDTAVLCCLSLCKCAGYSTEKSLLWRVGAGLMPMVSDIVFNGKVPWVYNPERLLPTSPLPVTGFELLVVGQLAAYGLDKGDPRTLVNSIDSERSTLCLAATCTVKHLLLSEDSPGFSNQTSLDTMVQKLSWRLRMVFTNSQMHLQEAYNRSLERMTCPVGVLQTFTSKLFGTKIHRKDSEEGTLDSGVTPAQEKEQKKSRSGQQTMSPNWTAHVIAYHEIVETIHQLLEIFLVAPMFAMEACKESYQHSCCRYLISSMHDVLGCSVDLVAQFLVPMTDLMATFHSPEFVHRWDPFSARLCVGAYMVLETTAEFILLLTRAALQSIDSICRSSLMKSLYKLLVERNVFICANFNEVVTAIDLEYFAESFNSLEALLLVCITDGNEPGISWSVLCLSTLVAMVDSTAPYNPWVTSSAAISPSFLENLKHYRAISELQKLSSTVPNHAAILQILRKLGKDTPGSLMAWENMADRWQVLTTNIVEGLSDGSENQTAILASPSMNKWISLTKGMTALSGALPVSPGEKVLEKRFLKTALELLRCSIDGHAGSTIRTVVREALENISPAAIPICLNMLEQHLTRILAQDADCVSEVNTLFVDQVISLLKPYFEGVCVGSYKYLSFVNTEAIVLQLAKYIGDYGLSNCTMQTHFCHVLHSMMICRKELCFRRESYFRNITSQYIVRWITDIREAVNDMSSQERDFLMIGMAVLAQLFFDLKLDDAVVDHPQDVYDLYWSCVHHIIEESAEEGTASEDAPSRGKNFGSDSLSQRHHRRPSVYSAGQHPTVFPSLGPALKGFISISLDGPQYMSELLELSQVAMSNLLCANTTCELKRADQDNGVVANNPFGRVLRYCQQCHVKCRAFFVENVAVILREGSQCQHRESMAARHLRKLCTILVTRHNNRYPITEALMKVTSSTGQDELCTVLSRLFYSRGLLYPLLEFFFMKELKKVVSPSSLFRSASHASRLVSSTMKHFGFSYASQLLKPILEEELKKFASGDISYEIDPNKLRDDDNSKLDYNRKNVISLTKKIFETVIDSIYHGTFPSQIITVCNCLLTCTSSRFPSHCESVVGNAFFLRFLNAMLTQPQKYGLVSANQEIPSSFHRGLVLVAKILQNIGNQLIFKKEEHMICFNPFVQSAIPIGKEFLVNISCTTVFAKDRASPEVFQFSEDDQRHLQKILWATQESIGFKIFTKRKVPEGQCLFQDLVLCLGNLGVPDGVSKASPGQQANKPDALARGTRKLGSREPWVAMWMDAAQRVKKSPNTTVESMSGHMLSLALHNMTSMDGKLRASAYNLLCTIINKFGLNVTTARSVPGAPTLLFSLGMDVVSSMSTELANGEPLITLEFLEETIHLCQECSAGMAVWTLSYLSPWLANLAKYAVGKLGQGESDKKRVVNIISDLVNTTVTDNEVSQALLEYVWKPCGQYSALIPGIVASLVEIISDYSLDSTVVSQGCGMIIALSCGEDLAGSNTVALAILEALDQVLTKCSHRGKLTDLEVWPEISILAFLLCNLVFNGRVSVIPLLPRLFQVIVIVNQYGPRLLHEAVHGLTVNILHALCLWADDIEEGEDCPFSSSLAVSSELQVRLDNLTQPLYLSAFGVGDEGTSDTWNEVTNELMVITLLLDVLKMCCSLMHCNQLLLQWEDAAERYVLKRETCQALLPRAILMLGMISERPEKYYHTILNVLEKACENLRRNEQAVCCVLAVLANIEYRMELNLSGHACLFWLSVGILQLNYPPVYCFGLDLMQASLRSLDSLAAFEKHRLVDLLVSERVAHETSLEKLNSLMFLWSPQKYFTLFIALLVLKAYQDPTSRLLAERVVCLVLAMSKDPAWESDSSANPSALSIFSSGIWPFVAALLPINEEAGNFLHILSRQTAPIHHVANLRCSRLVRQVHDAVHRSISNSLLQLSENEEFKGHLSTMDSSAATVSLSKAITSLSARQKTRNTPQSDTEGDEALSMVITSCLNADQDRDQLLVYMFAVATAPSNVAMPQIARLATCKAFESEDSQILVTFLTAATLSLCEEVDQVTRVCQYITALATHFRTTFSKICDVVHNLLRNALGRFPAVMDHPSIITLSNIIASTAGDDFDDAFTSPIITGLGFGGAVQFLFHWNSDKNVQEAASVVSQFVRGVASSDSPKLLQAAL